eukprot:PhF_6_TR42735/c0_g1_i1/m.64585
MSPFTLPLCHGFSSITQSLCQNRYHRLRGKDAQCGITCPFVIQQPIGLQFKKQETETSSVKGVDTLRFVLSPESLQSGEQHPPNKCYRQHREGFINMSVPLYAPLLVSKPYYLDANVTGLLNFTLKDGKPMIPD